MRILLIEDDELLADAIVRGMSAAGLVVDHAGSAELAQSAIVTEHFDLAVVDLGLPGADGLSLIRTLRGQGSSMPLLVLTARNTLQDKVNALNLGADDFLMKPFEQAELVARCRALLRRAGQAPSGVLRLGRLSINLLGHQVTVDDRPIELTQREWALLESLTHSVGRVVSKDHLIQALTGWDQDLSPNAIETHVSRLRAKIGDAAVIRAIRGLGYRLEEAKGRDG